MRKDTNWHGPVPLTLSLSHTLLLSRTRADHDLKLVSLALPDSAALEVTLQADE